MPAPVNPRTYRSARRRASAEDTRRRIVVSARDLFASQGWAGTSLAQVAAAAGVSVDTVYASIGRKPQLLVAAHDAALAGGEDPVPALERDYVLAVRAATGARRKIEVYAEALGGLLPRTVPLLLALREAGHTDEQCRAAYAAVSERRAANMRLFAADLRETGELRPEISDDLIADLVWSMNGPEYFELVSTRGWSSRTYAEILVEVWTRTLLRVP